MTRTFKILFYSPLTLETRNPISMVLSGPSRVAVDKKFSMLITITNNTKKTIKNIETEMRIPEGLIYIVSQPEGTYTEGLLNDKHTYLSWKIPEITAQKKSKIEITLLGLNGQCLVKARLRCNEIKLGAKITISVA